MTGTCGGDGPADEPACVRCQRQGGAEAPAFLGCSSPWGQRRRRSRGSSFRSSPGSSAGWRQRTPASSSAGARTMCWPARSMPSMSTSTPPMRARLSNCVGPLGMQEDTARRMIREVDRARLAYHRRFAHYAPDDPAHKHVIINSTLLGVEGTARPWRPLCGSGADGGKWTDNNIL